MVEGYHAAPRPERPPPHLAQREPAPGRAAEEAPQRPEPPRMVAPRAETARAQRAQTPAFGEVGRVRERRRARRATGHVTGHEARSSPRVIDGGAGPRPG